MTTINCNALKELIPAGARLLCAVSGGADSMCMLSLLNSNREYLHIEVSAAHFEHGIRGEEALRDAAFVEQFCRDNGIPYITGHGNVPEYAEKNGIGMEEAARILRYSFLDEAAEKLNCNLIATAHNADDNVETVLFNLARGGGNRGLQGIPLKRNNIIRPMLNFSREEIEQYLSENGIPHVEDSTNFSDDYSRNMIRHKVMPVLREINPGLDDAVSRTCTLLRDDEDYISKSVDDFIEKHYDGESLPVCELSTLHRAVSSRVVRSILGSGLSMEHVDSVLNLCSLEGLAYADIPGRRVKKEQGRLYFSDSATCPIPDIVIVPGERYTIPEAELEISADMCEYPESVHGLLNTFFIKYDEIHGALVCSSRKPGDKLKVLGRGCSKTVKQLFLEHGYTQKQRDLCPVFRDGEGVLAVYKLALADRSKPCPGEKAVKITITDISEDR